MSFLPITDTIPTQPPVGAFSMIASGTIYRGNGVYLCGDNQVKVPTDDNQRLFGIADYTKTDSEYISIYSVGNLVSCRLSASTIPSAGAFVGVIAGGYISQDATYNSGAVVTKEASTNGGVGEILILGTEYVH